MAINMVCEKCSNISQEEADRIYQNIEESNRAIADLRQQVTALKHQSIQSHGVERKRIKSDRLEIIWHECRMKGSMGYKDVMVILSLSHRMSAYRLMRQAEDEYSKDLLLVRSINSKMLRLVWRGD